MIYAIFLPLLVSWLFHKTGQKKVYLSYFITGSLLIIVPALLLVLRVLNAGVVDPSAIAFDRPSAGNLLNAIFQLLFVGLFFQFIFNKTFGLSKPKK
jgi:Na+/phosphate symporter